MSEQNQAVVRRIIEDYWNKKNPALAGELFAVDSSLHIPDGDLPKGMPGVAQLYSAYATAFPDFHLKIEDTVADFDRVAVSYSESQVAVRHCKGGERIARDFLGFRQAECHWNDCCEAEHVFDHGASSYSW